MLKPHKTVPKLIVFASALLLFPSVQAADSDEIATCLAKWGKAPFTRNSKFREISAKVKVMGIGQDINETNKTSEPELVLIRPAVTVMAKTVINLGNPNGWYCLKGDVAVMGKMEINVNCKAHFASSKDGATVMGSDNHGAGTTVMGSTRVNRVGECGVTAKKSAKEKKEETETAKEPETDTE